MTDTTTWPSIHDEAPTVAPDYRWDVDFQDWVPYLPAELVNADDN